MKRDIGSNQEDARELELGLFAREKPVNTLNFLGKRRLGKIYDEIAYNNRMLIKNYARDGLFPFCRGGETNDCFEKMYYVTYRIPKNSKFSPKWYVVQNKYPNIITEYDNFYMISLYTGTGDGWELK